MPDFPKLKTNAVAQYPATKTVSYRNQILRFVDGKEQRYRDSSGPRQEWVIRLHALDEAEYTRILDFFHDQRGRFGSFAFTDPWDGKSYPDCSLASDDLACLSKGEMNTDLALRVVENWS